MSTFETNNGPKSGERVWMPDYLFSMSGSVIFLTGTPLSGKSTLSPMISASIAECSQQPMDIIRLIAQAQEEMRPESERNPFTQFGSCDSYSLVGDGSYSRENLITGFNLYASAVFNPLNYVIPKLEVQGVSNVLFEGVQLTPSLVSPYLGGNNRIVIVTTTEDRLEQNLNQLFGDDHELRQRYSIERLMLIQEELLKQSREITPDKTIIVDNSGEVAHTFLQIMSSLLNSGVIYRK